MDLWARRLNSQSEKGVVYLQKSLKDAKKKTLQHGKEVEKIMKAGGAPHLVPLSTSQCNHPSTTIGDCGRQRRKGWALSGNHCTE